MPYPLGFYAKWMDGRIDDPNAGWKGRGVWATYGTRTPFHLETGKGTRPKVVKFQLRPDPLARKLSVDRRERRRPDRRLDAGAPDFVLDYISVNTFWTILFIIHALLAVALLGALTHQAVSVLMPVRQAAGRAWLRHPLPRRARRGLRASRSACCGS